MAYTLDQLYSDGLAATFSYLLPIAAGNSTITYGQIADALQRDLRITGKVFPTHIGPVVGRLMEKIHGVVPDAPLINILIVNGKSGEPGDGADGFLRERFGVTTKPLPRQVKRDLVGKAAHEVYAYGRWSEVFKKLFGTTPPPSDPSVLIDGAERDGSPPTKAGKAFGGLAESKEHKALKHFILQHPRTVGAARKPTKSQVELQLLSGDEVDVFFETGTRIDLVEVKSVRSSEPDLLRGIYQCIKYRAVFHAQRVGTTPDMCIFSTLVVEVHPPSYIMDLARLHSVKVVRVNR
jgi:hypothetical protein